MVIFKGKMAWSQAFGLKPTLLPKLCLLLVGGWVGGFVPKKKCPPPWSLSESMAGTPENKTPPSPMRW